MPITRCDNRSDPDNRRKIVQEFNIRPLARAKLPGGVAYEGCCGPIEDWVYTFSYESRADKADSGLFHTGYACGDDFLDLLGLARPPVFSPLALKSHAGSRPGNGTSSSAGNISTQLSGLNQEIYNAINILTIAFGPPDAALKSLLEALARAPGIDLNAGQVKYLNGVVARKAQGKTVTQVIADLQNAHSNFRQFGFPKINAILLSQGKASNF